MRSRTARQTGSDEGQLLLRYQPTRAERITAGELREVPLGAACAGFEPPLAVSAALWQHVQTVPASHRQRESVPERWRLVLRLAATASAQMLRAGLAELLFIVVLRTADGPEKDRAHFKTLRLMVERAPGGGEVFILSYPEPG